MYSKLGNLAAVHSLFLQSPTASSSLHTKKNVNGVHNIFPVFTSFLATADPSTLSFKELRASIVRLEGDLKTLQGKHARKPCT